MNELITPNLLRLASIIATTYYRKAPRVLDLEEMRSRALEVLVRAANRYPEYCKERGYDVSVASDWFSSYAGKWMKGAMIDYLRELDPLTRPQRHDYRLVTSAQDSGTAPEDLPTITGLTVDRIRTVIARQHDLRPDLRLVDPSDGDRGVAGCNRDGRSFLEPEAPDDTESTSQVRAMLEVVADAVRQLPPLAQVVLAMRFHQEKQLADIGAELGLSVEKIIKILDDALPTVVTALREFCTASYADLGDRRKAGELDDVAQFRPARDESRPRATRRPRASSPG